MIKRQWLRHLFKAFLSTVLSNAHEVRNHAEHKCGWWRLKVFDVIPAFLRY